MKLLFDQNISFRIAKKLQDVFPSCAQVRELGLENSIKYLLSIRTLFTRRIFCFIL